MAGTATAHRSRAPKAPEPAPEPTPDPREVKTSFNVPFILPARQHLVSGQNLDFDVKAASTALAVSAQTPEMSSSIKDAIISSTSGKKKSAPSPELVSAAEEISKAVQDYLVKNSDFTSDSAISAEALKKGEGKIKADGLRDLLLDDAASAEIKTAVTNFLHAKGLKDPIPDERRKADIGSLAEKLIEIELKDLTIDPQVQTYSLGGGAIEVKFVQKTDSQPSQVYISNTQTGVEAVFAPSFTDATGAADANALSAYEDCIEAFKGTKAHPDIKALAQLVTKEDFERFFTLLMDFSQASWDQSKLQFVSSPTPPTSPMQFIESIIGRQHALKVDSAPILDADAIVDKLNNEYAQKLSAGKKPDIKSQFEALVDTSAIAFHLTDVNALDSPQCIIRSEFGRHTVDMSFPLIPLDVSFKIDPQTNTQLLLDNFQKLTEAFAKDGEVVSLADSSAFRMLVGVGQISEIKGRRDFPAEIRGLNILGAILAPEAKIEHVNFKDSALDFSGLETTISNCTFKNCRVSLALRGAKISDSKFDKKSILFGELNAELKGTEIHGNAFGLDASRITFDPSDNVKRQFKGAIFNSAKIPREILAISYRLPQKHVDKEFKRLDDAFDQRVIRDLLHTYGATSLNGAGLLSYLNPFKAAFSPNTPQNEVVQSRYTEPTSGHPALLDIGEGEFVLRLFLDKKMASMLGKEGSLFTTPERAQSISMQTRFQDGNFKTFRHALDFIHLRRRIDIRDDDGHMVRI